MRNFKQFLKIHVYASRRFPLQTKEFRRLAHQVARDELSRIRHKLQLTGRNLVLNIRIVSNRQIQRINRIFLGKDSPTDVISFSYIDEADLSFAEREHAPCVLGDVAVSYEMASDRKRRLRNSFKKEMALYIIHGVLHVFGHDDREEKHRQKMNRKQRGYLKKYWMRGNG
ncbi:MAG: rRNA maturation RNase YbeY [Candidatus Aureabacteria bacterium]|nr:rRNA maturation RNase YbeY [Candidatus Auribacterota bacterium]